jgi:DNA-directed RNA polymerase subunit RPC12/RpoP
MMCNGTVRTSSGTRPCNAGTVYKCQRCGAVGCTTAGCSNQNFGGQSGTGINCNKCGDANKRPVN